MKLSVSMIVKNEEAALEKCLNSVQGVDEIVIVDTGSIDKSIEIAKKFTDKVYSGDEFLWTDEFAKSRNQSLQLCTGDWILIIDADEVLESGGIAKVRAAIDSAKDFKTIYVWCNSMRGSAEHKSPRIFKRCPEVFWVGDIHNHINLVEPFQEKNPADINLFYGYSEAHKKDPDRALRILTKVLQKNPKAVRETFYLAREYWYRKDYVTAIRWYEDYLTRAVWAPEMADAWLMLARCYWFTRKGDQARAACLQAIKVNANFQEALLFMADLSGPKNAIRWRYFASSASNEGVLFLRTNKDSAKALDIDVEKKFGVYRPHSDLAMGSFSVGSGCEVSTGVSFDCTGNISIGDHCIFGKDVKVHTHKHDLYHGKVLDITKEHGIEPTDLKIGTNVVLAEAVTILAGVCEIGESAVIGNNSVLTHSVGAGEIWAGNPAKLIGRR